MKKVKIQLSTSLQSTLLIVEVTIDIIGDTKRNKRKKKNIPKKEFTTNLRSLMKKDKTNHNSLLM